MLVFFTPKARAQLRDIYDYVARDNSTAARAVVMRVEAVARFLGDNPEAGYRLPRGRLRRFPVRPFPYLVYYEVSEKTVRIIRIRHAAQYRRAFHDEAVPFKMEKLWPLTDEERVDLEEAVREMERGDAATDEEVAAAFRRKL